MAGLPPPQSPNKERGGFGVRVLFRLLFSGFSLAPVSPLISVYGVPVSWQPPFTSPAAAAAAARFPLPVLLFLFAVATAAAAAARHIKRISFSQFSQFPKSKSKLDFRGNPPTISDSCFDCVTATKGSFCVLLFRHLFNFEISQGRASWGRGQSILWLGCCSSLVR